jgi:hypothetical protein
VPTYRIVLRDTRRHIADVKDIECTSDEEATVKAQTLVDGHAIELYEQGRFITFFPAKN